MNPDRDLARLRTQNARLRADYDRQRQQLRQLHRAPAARKATPVAVPFELADPRRRPKAGSKVLPALTPPLLLGRQMGAAIGAELKAMALEAMALVKLLIAQPDLRGAMDALSADEAAQRLQALQARWAAKFDSLAHTWSRRMVGGVIGHSNAQLDLSLRDITPQFAIESTLQSPRLRAVVEAAAQTSVGLITRIPERFLGAVQTQVMNAITTGSGLEELVPYLTKKYKGDVRHAHLTALDQIRKVSESVNATRLQSLGVEEYVWMHTGGERYPRKLHQSYSGRTFRYDDPPVVDERTGVRGKPGDAISCRCRARPVLNFTKMAEA